MASERRGRDILLEVLRTEGVVHIFGNPGSTELPLVDALASATDLRYVLALQEASAVGMADGYAQATGRPAFLNLHTSAGLGNAIGNLTNAQANGAPLVVTAGQQDERHLAADPLLSGPLTEIASGSVKWAHEVRSVGELATILRRAFHDAMTPPAGPVFVSLRMDLLERDAAGATTPPPSIVDRRPIAGGLDELAALLTEPPVGRVAIVAGDEVASSSAVPELVRLAEMLGAPVHGSPLHSRAVFPPLHPMWRGMLPYAADAVAAVLAGYQRVLLIGTKAFMAYPYTPGPAVPDGVELLHLSPDPAQLGRRWPVRFGSAGDPQATLAALLPLVEARADAAAAAAAVAAVAERAEARRREVAALEATAESRYDTAPMDPMAAAHALVRAVPSGALIVDEAITTGGYIRGFHHEPVPDRYFFCKGGGLGWGMPAALGVSLAHGRDFVLCAVGDGSAMYSPQALWTAAHERLPVLFAVVNNRQYLILKNYLRAMAGDTVRTGNFVAMDIVEPPVDYVGLARSMGVDATLVEKAHDVGDAVQAAIDSGRPHLLELPIAAPA
jgi:benzoylformate decarboxylase